MEQEEGLETSGTEAWTLPLLLLLPLPLSTSGGEEGGKGLSFCPPAPLRELESFHTSSSKYRFNYTRPLLLGYAIYCNIAEGGGVVV